MRRQFLLAGALLAVVALAGCGAPAGSASMDPVNDTEIDERASRGLATDDRVRLDPEARVIVEAIENGSGTIEAPSPPIDEGLPFAYKGAYYALDRTVVDRRTATSVSLLIDYNTSNATGDRIAYEDLPAPDRRALTGLLPPRERMDRAGYDLGTGAIYNDSELAASVLAPEQRYDVVIYEGEPYPVRLDGTREVTVRTYRYAATRIADSAEAYAADLKAAHLFELSGLSEAERAVVESAIEDDYYADDTDDTAFRSVVERFRRQEAVRSDEYSGEWLVRYEGTVYWAELRYDGFVEE